MKRLFIIVPMLFIIGIANLSSALDNAKKTLPPKKLTEAEKAAMVVKSFLELMDAGKYEEAFLHLDFDVIIKEQKLDPSKMSSRDKERQIKAYKNITKNMFASEKQQAKFRNFSLGQFKQTANTATLEIINTPPKSAAGQPIIKTFKMILNNGVWKIYGIVQQLK